MSGCYPNPVLTGEEWRKLKAEWTHDYGRRHMDDRGVKYEDEATPARENPVPSPSEIIANPRAYLPEQQPGNENDRER